MPYSTKDTKGYHDFDPYKRARLKGIQGSFKGNYTVPLRGFGVIQGRFRVVVMASYKPLEPGEGESRQPNEGY